MIKIAFNRFKDFLKEQYPLYEFGIKPDLITKDMMEHFVEYLQSRSVGEGAESIYQRFKKVVRYAIGHEVMLKAPCKGVVCKVDEQILRKDVLSMDEIQSLIQYHYENENPNVRRAFIPANSGVVIPLNDGLLSLIGEAPDDLNTSIFNLP